MRSVLVGYFCLIALLEGLLSANNSVAANSAFSFGSQHIVMMMGLSMLLIGLTSVAVIKNGNFKIAPLIIVEAALFLFFLLSSMYSATFMVSFGQAVISIFGLMISMIIGRHCFFTKNINFDYFFSLWLLILLCTYLVKFLLQVYFQNQVRLVPSDEKALLAAICGIYFIYRLSAIRSLISVSLLFVGASISAFLASIPLLLSSEKRIVGLILSLFFVTGGYFIFLQVESGTLSIYGKSVEYLISGSGRFTVYKELMHIIANSHPLQWIIGNGYMSERAALIGKDLSWTVDAHNNVLQSMYGVGVIGTALMLYLWYRFANFFLKEAAVISRQYSKLFFYAVVACAAFGLTSSHFFSRPSMSAIFITSLYYFCWLKIISTKQQSLRGALDE